MGASHRKCHGTRERVSIGNIVLAVEGTIYSEVLLLLGGAVVAAPLFKRIGLGTILGYLAAGIAIGPAARLITGGEEILHVAELGIVFLLFIIGLELKPSRLWALRRDIFGLGLAQVVLTGIVLAALGVLLAGLSYPAAIVIGFGLALSSTAFAMQLLEQEGTTNTRHGQTTFSILLFQDLAIVPLLALIPLLSPGEGTQAAVLPQFGITIAAIATLLIAGRYLINPLFRIIANTGAKEAMIAAALLVVLGAATLMQVAGLSMAMGAFIAGVMLAESSYRHELEADIEPFRGILLGLFFMAVGLSLELDVIVENWQTILLAVPVLMAVKVAVTYTVCRLFNCKHDDAVRVAFLLPQGGEFAFVLFSVAASASIFPLETASMLIAIVTVSMALMPLFAPASKAFLTADQPEEMEEDFDGAGGNVLMIGFSRFGQIASQILLTGGSSVTIIDHSADRVRSAGKFGFRIYFGDGTRKDVLEAAGIRRAKVVAVATNKKETTDKIVELIQSEFPDARLYVRSYDRTHTLQLRARGVDYELRETFESGLLFGQKTLEALGMDQETASAIREDVRQRDEERLALQAVDGLQAGRWLTKPVTPEPLIKPTRESKRLDNEAIDDKTPEVADS
ncbi:monovalent cation:proton antiporter-2 (CPA2) family protein [Mesorhizobium sp. ZC-5]|uniref:monovalent cation:proton antiporter-2 (CPA2) family protein n=1 Tax=Mesorhizobium sp. ZC-5 TaxID=2986066 RepID=UPI0021E86842|nr:monovalent cation:proton antiporter-2 (CPA2) family protein [Mesorhizobium sp. ZC-5]MCV3242279.1 monovalent cation:proton antiporter-2 (CPA2) family protein [Mesorhizobium sp. ZC-5]